MRGFASGKYAVKAGAGPAALFTIRTTVFFDGAFCRRPAGRAWPGLLNLHSRPKMGLSSLATDAAIGRLGAS
jgi:hypothetical protein